MIQDAEINRAEVVQEVRRAFDQYESALIAHDVAALDQWFLQRADTVRFGLAEHNYGAASIARWRRAAQPVHPLRRLLRVVITTFGADTASVCAEFESPDSMLRGRQSQHWIRHSDGWKIVSAHVSAIDPRGLTQD